MIKVKKFIYAKKFNGAPKESDFIMINEDLNPELKANEILCAAEYLSMDAGLRAYANLYQEGIVMFGGQIAKVLDSKHSQFPKGSYIYHRYGWQSHVIMNPDKMTGLKPYVLPDFGKFPVSLGVGCLGMTGNTAYFGLKEICRPKKDETIVISGAAGGVGNHVGQIAKIIGCKVIGICGSDEKCEWLKNELGFDHALNYKSDDFKSKFSKACPDGVDCYFDNVGGELSTKVITKMNKYGRIAVCGAVSLYNLKDMNDVKVTELNRNFIYKELRMEGFIVWRFGNRWMEGIEQNLQWLKEGKLKYRETIVNGFENAPKALIDTLNGVNIGKSIVKC